MTTVARPQSAQDTLPRQGERGFTLIELSIVLVIIGLLIGGILQGQEMINNTRLKSTVAQNDAITASAQTFQDKYRALPGDAPAAIAAVIGAPAAPAGAPGDGIIGATVAGAAVALPAGIAATSEAAHALEQLQWAGLLQGVEDVGAAGNFFVLPASVDQGGLDLATFIFAAGDNRLAVRLRATAAAAAAPGPVLIPRDALSMDTKYDDGNPAAGRWRSDGNAAACHNAAAVPVYTAGTVVGCNLVMSIR